MRLWRRLPGFRPLYAEAVFAGAAAIAGMCCAGAEFGSGTSGCRHLRPTGQGRKARAEAAEVLRVDPKWTNRGTGRRIYVFKRVEDAEHLFDGLRKAGLPEG